jgi:hypothetical protein
VAILATIGTWLASYGLGAILKFASDALGNYLAQRQADTNAKAAGQAEVTSTINKESADAERRASEVAVNRPDVSAVVAGMERGDTF